jgi:hypothetical protein
LPSGIAFAWLVAEPVVINPIAAAIVSNTFLIASFSRRLGDH